MIYYKSFNLNNQSRRQSTVGEIVNLQSIDAQVFQDTMPYIHLVWSVPFQIAGNFIHQFIINSSFFSWIIQTLFISFIQQFINFINSSLHHFIQHFIMGLELLGFVLHIIVSIHLHRNT